MRVAVFGKSLNPELSGVFREMLDILQDRRCRIIIHDTFAKHLVSETGYSLNFDTFSCHSHLEEKCDVLLSIGGDGTLLDTLSLIRNSGIPILGVNLGRLGFLSSVSKSEIKHAIDCLLAGNYELDQRSLLRLETPNNPFGELNYALNEISMHYHGTPSLISIKVSVNDLYLNSYWADGLIVSTPTGSTAYSLSCNGPIVYPDTKTLLITPISSHNLTVRPIIIPDNSVIRISVSSRNGKFVAGLDSRFEVFNSETVLNVKKEDFMINLIKLPGKTFFSTIREKLKWGLDVRSKL